MAKGTDLMANERRPPTARGKSRVQIMLPEPYRDRLYARALSEGLSVSEVVRRELRSFLFGNGAAVGE